MSSAARKVLEQALALPEREREELVRVLSDSLAPEMIALSLVWTSEIGRRISEIERGQVEPIAWSDLEARLRRRIDAPRLGPRRSPQPR